MKPIEQDSSASPPTAPGPCVGGRPPGIDYRQLVVVCVASFIVWSGFGAILPYLPIFLQEQAHASVALIGVIAAAYYVGTFAASSPMGALADRIGRKPVLVAGVSLYALATGLFLTTTEPGWFIVFRFLEGVGAGAVMPAGQAFVADITGESSRSRAYGWLTSAQFGGLVAGPALAMPLYALGGGHGNRGFYYIFVVTSILAALAALALFVTLREPHHVFTMRTDGVRRPPYRTLVTRPLGAFLVVAATANFAMGAWQVIWSLWLRRLGASMDFVGLTFIVFSVPMLLSFLGGRLADRGNRYRIMYIGFGVVAMCWMVYGSTHDLAVLLVFCAVEGFAYALALPAKQAFLVMTSPARWLGSVQGLESSAMNVAAFVGTVTAPFLYGRISGYTITLGGLVAFAGLVMTAPTLSRQWRRLTA